MIRGLVAAAALALAACSKAPTETLRFMALGTLVEITAHDAPPGWDEDLRRSHEPWLARWGADMYAYGDGELARANAAWARGECVALSEDLSALVAAAARLEARHGDRFVPAMGAVTTLWKLHDTDAANWQPPADAALEQALNPAPSTRFLTNRDGLTCADGPVQLDTGGFAKGVALDALIAALQAAGADGALVNVGGDLSALGSSPDAPWRAGIQDPKAAGALAIVDVHSGESVMTSGNYARSFVFDGRRYAHILDPATGRPVQGIASVTVIGGDATDADAAATALFVAAGRARASGKWPQLPAVADAKTFVVIDVDGAAVLSAAMTRRLIWLRRPDHVHTAP